MKNSILVIFLSLLLSSASYARESVEQFMLDICLVADKQIRDEFERDHPEYQDMIFVEREINRLEDEIEQSIELKIVTGNEPPEEKLKLLFKILQTFSNAPEDEIQNLVSQYIAGAGFKLELFDKLVPNLVSGQPHILPGNSALGDVKIEFNDEQIIFKQNFNGTKVDHFNHAIINYELSIIFDRALGTYVTDVKVLSYRPIAARLENGYFQEKKFTKNIQELLLGLGKGHVYEIHDRMAIQTELHNYNSKLLDVLINSHHSQCYEILYQAPSLQDEALKLSTDYLNRQNLIQNKDEKTGGMGSESHGESKKSTGVN